jgi:hypothetical protein
MIPRRLISSRKTVVIRFGEEVAGGEAIAFADSPTRLPITPAPTVFPKPLREIIDFIIHTPPVEMWDSAFLARFSSIFDCARTL